jgi:hypothetical protein
LSFNILLSDEMNNEREVPIIGKISNPFKLNYEIENDYIEDSMKS